MGKNIQDVINDGVKKLSITAEDIIKQAVKLPIVRVDRADFLRKELKKYGVSQEMC